MRDFATPFRNGQFGDLYNGVMRYRYRDVLCQKNPLDIAIYMRLIWDAQPRTIIEIGSKAGGSALLFRDIARSFGLDCGVVSIDLRPPPASFEGIRFLEGDALSLGEAFRQYDLHACARPWLVIDDSAHTFAACTAVLEFFRATLHEGEYLVIEDGALADFGWADRYQGGPNAAIVHYFEANPEVFDVATNYCDMFGQNATYNPNAYLRKRSLNADAEASRRDADNAIRGEVPHIAALKYIHRLLSPALYLEIGVNRGRSLRLAKGKAIGVDPVYRLDYQLPVETTFVEATSDAFFEERASKLLAGNAPDFIFIDGMHHFEYALRDFINAERLAPAHGLIVIDDVIPNHPAQGTRIRHTMLWTGDIWKLQAILRTHRPDLYLLPLDTAPTGMLLVVGLDPSNRTLTERYDSIVKSYASMEDVPASALSRAEAVSPKGPEVRRVIRRLVSMREGKTRPDRLVKRLRVANSLQRP